MSGFWANRRAAVAKEAEAEAAALVVEEEARNEAELAERKDEEILAELDLPEPETLESPEAVREFMASAVPQRLKTRALRRLWRLNPVLANLDGLVDYGQDFTDSAMVVENLQTAYQVGKGMLSHIEYLAEKAAEAEAAAEEAEAEDEDEVIEIEVADLETAEPAPLPETPEPVAGVAPEAEVYVPRPRRMTFTFDDQRNA